MELITCCFHFWMTLLVEYQYPRVSSSHQSVIRYDLELTFSLNCSLMNFEIIRNKGFQLPQAKLNLIGFDYFSFSFISHTSLAFKYSSLNVPGEDNSRITRRVLAIYIIFILFIWLFKVTC